MSDNSSKHIRVSCACGAKINLPAAAAGKKAKCPKCEAIFPVPEQKQDETPQDEGPLSLLDELASQADSAPAVESGAPGENSVECPQCGSGMPAGSLQCRSCGHASTRASRAPLPSSSDKPRSGSTFGMGTFWMGIVLSTIGALIGAAIWAVVAIVTDYEIGWIAIGLGLLAGFGMAFGSLRSGPAIGATAAVIALAGILAAKVMIVGYYDNQNQSTVTEIADFLSSDEHNMARSNVATRARQEKRQVSAEWDDLFDTEMNDIEALSSTEREAELVQYRQWRDEDRWEDQEWIRDYLIYESASDAVKDKLGEDHAEGYAVLPEEEWQSIYDSAAEAVDAKSAEDRVKTAREIIEQAEQEYEEFLASLRSGVSTFSSSEGIEYFFKNAFSGMDALFAAFAVFTAFRTANMKEE